MKKKFRLWKVAGIIVGLLAGLILIWILVNQLMTAYEQKKHQPPGQLVEIDGENMHVYMKGDGENTIVLLSGLGTAAPVLDFEPLINELSKNHRVVVVEPFGYGWSDITDKDRTVENIVEELRLALKKSNINGPYILMPHSISGIYSMYYVNKYPNEIKAIIGIDPTLPKAFKYFRESPPTMSKCMSLLGPTGIARLAMYMTPNDFLPIANEGTYSEENLEKTKMITAWKGYNKNVVAETNEMKNNSKKTVDLSFPKEMPVMIFTTKEDKITKDGRSIKSFYQMQLSKLVSKKLVLLEGHHYLHWTQYKEMSKYVHEFLTKAVN